MIDRSFDFALWLQWRAVLFWFINGVGVITSVAAISYTSKSKYNTSLFALLIMMVMLVLLGYFPIEWGYSTDRANYANDFITLKYYNQTSAFIGDYGFVLLTKFLGKFLTVQQYFVAITLIYLTNYLIAIRKLVSNKSFWLVVGVIVSMGFTSYAINTMRAGLALSFLVLGLALYPNKWKMIICLWIGTTIHGSVVIPAIAIAICYFYPNTRLYYKLWFLSIPLSFIAGGFFSTLFAGMGEEDRTHYLTETINTSYNIGFRIDFILYSLVPLLVGGYYLFKKNVNDRFYTLLYNTYIITNIFWILVIRSSYSDRFAYLSWFLIPFILVYPLLKHKMKLQENLWLGAIIMGETLFRIIF